MHSRNNRDCLTGKLTGEVATAIEGVFTELYPDGLICGEDFQPAESYAHMTGSRVRLGVEILRDLPLSLDDLIACVEVPGGARLHGIILYPIPLEKI
jgi:hypothetical protein